MYFKEFNLKFNFCIYNKINKIYFKFFIELSTNSYIKIYIKIYIYNKINFKINKFNKYYK